MFLSYPKPSKTKIACVINKHSLDINLKELDKFNNFIGVNLDEINIENFQFDLFFIIDDVLTDELRINIISQLESITNRNPIFDKFFENIVFDHQLLTDKNMSDNEIKIYVKRFGNSGRFVN